MSDLYYPNVPHDTTPKAPPIVSSPYFPQIEPDIFRAEMRVNNTITAARVYGVLVSSVAYVNAQLTTFRLTAQEAGQTTLAESSAETIDGVPVVETRYRDAVYYHAKSHLVEKYQDYDSVGQEPQDKQKAASALKRNTHNAIADIKGDTRTRCLLV